MLNKSSYYDFCTKADAGYQERSKFYRIKPIGLGTPYMECLSSYIIRLAEAHSIRVIDIVKTALKETGARTVTPSIDKLNGMGTNVANIIDGLEKLVLRDDLRLLGILNWKGFIKNKEVIKDHKEWCPNCYYEWNKFGYILYEPLLWHIKGIHFCYKHNTYLTDTCSTCKSKLEVNRDFEKVGYCVKCNTFLGKNPIRKECKRSAIESEFADYIAEYIVNARNIAEMKPDTREESVNLKNVLDRINREKSVAFSMFQESSSNFRFF